MASGPLDTAYRQLTQAVDALCTTAETGADDELISVLTLCEGITRRLDRLTADMVAALERRGTFAERGYSRTSVRDIAEADDLAALIAFLAGPGSARITGQVISVNGGISVA